MKRRCVCGCKRRHGMQFHHVVYKQELRRVAAAGVRGGPPDVTRELTLMADPRNLVLVAQHCHAQHHNRQRPLWLDVLPDSAFEFAEQVLGPGPAYEYLRRRYAGEDERLERIRAVADHPGDDADALGTRDG